MPGLYGFITPEIDISLQLDSMKETLKSDWTKLDENWVDPSFGIGLGRVGLGIFQPDLQPLIKNGRVLFVIGEIVNKEELMAMVVPEERHPLAANKELILTLFEQYGYKTFELLNGSFAIAIWEISEKRLILACDYAGLRPLFYANLGNRFCFSSEIKAILSLNWFPRLVNDEAVIDLLAFGFPQGDLTLFDQIKRLQPGMILTVKNGNLNIQEGFRVRFIENAKHISESEHEEQISNLLEKSLRARVKPDVKVGLTLSGGMDTRLLLAACSYFNLELPTFTYGEKHSRDQYRAKLISEIAGFSHHSFFLKKEYLKENAPIILKRCEGRVDCFLSHGLLLHNMKKWVDIMILGNGGEYLFCTGRDYYPKSLDVIPDQPYETYYQFRNSCFKEENWPKLLNQKLLKLKDYPREKLFNLLQIFDFENVDQAIDGYRFNIVQMNRTLQGLYLVNHVLEFSEPYFDRDLVIYAASLPFHLKRDRLFQKALLEKYNKVIASVEGGHLHIEPPLQKFYRKNIKRVKRRLVKYNILDQKILAKPSATFSDLHKLTRYPTNRDWIETNLLNTSGKIYDFVNPEYVQDIVKQHMNAETNYTKQINILMTLELFLQQYI